MPEATYDELEQLEPGDELTNGDVTLTIVEVEQEGLPSDYTVTYDNGVTQTLFELHSAVNKHGSIWPVED